MPGMDSKDGWSLGIDSYQGMPAAMPDVRQQLTAA
jgi:hypothetical protein